MTKTKQRQNTVLWRSLYIIQSVQSFQIDFMFVLQVSLTRAAVEAAKLAGRELGIPEDEYMTGQIRHQIRSGPLNFKDTIVQVVKPVGMYELNGINKPDNFY